MRRACVLLVLAMVPLCQAGTFVPYVCTGGTDGSQDGYMIGVPGSDARLVMGTDKTAKGLQIGDTEVGQGVPCWQGACAAVWHGLLTPGYFIYH
jgi:hypothetical protein